MTAGAAVEVVTEFISNDDSKMRLTKGLFGRDQRCTTAKPILPELGGFVGGCKDVTEMPESCR